MNIWGKSIGQEFFLLYFCSKEINLKRNEI